jgi:hypothetical protein
MRGIRSIVLYFSRVGFKCVRHAISCAFLADFAGIITAIIAGYSSSHRFPGYNVSPSVIVDSTMDDNSELGIAITEARAAKGKLEHAKGFERNHNRTINQLDERIFGMFAMLVLVILISVWAFDVPALIRYAVTIVAGAIFVYCKSMATKRKKDLDALRQQQAKEHSQNM